jgi:proline iminopeptidase
MPSLSGADGTVLAYHRAGEGTPLICLPGGPMQSSAYLGDLGGLTAHRSLVRLDLRGTGESAAPADPSTYRCDRQVDDVEALRVHLGLDRVDLLGHSAGGTLAVLYAARHPHRIDRLVLVTPSPRPVGLEISDADRRAVAEQRGGEPWFPDAFAAFERIWAGAPREGDWHAITPFMNGRWNADVLALLAREESEKNPEAAAVYYADGALDPTGTTAALAGLDAPVLVVGGGYDVGLPPAHAEAYTRLFGRSELAVLPGGGHYPWRDDPAWFVRTLDAFLA